MAFETRKRRKFEGDLNNFLDIEQMRSGMSTTQPPTILVGKESQINIPTSILSAKCPEELVYRIVCDSKEVYTKYELLAIIRKLLSPDPVSGECEYIS